MSVQGHNPWIACMSVWGSTLQSLVAHASRENVSGKGDDCLAHYRRDFPSATLSDTEAFRMDGGEKLSVHEHQRSDDRSEHDAKHPTAARSGRNENSGTRRFGPDAARSTISSSLVWNLDEAVPGCFWHCAKRDGAKQSRPSDGTPCSRSARALCNSRVPEPQFLARGGVVGGDAAGLPPGLQREFHLE